MKNKGFTLVELLGVIVVLALLVVLVFPSIINSVRDSSKKTDSLTLDLIYNAADLYIDNNKNSFYKTNGNMYAIELQDLVDEGLLVSPIKLSESDDDVTNQKCVQVSYNDDFQYELKDRGACKTIYSNGQIIYFDVATGKSCSESEYKIDNSNTGYNGYTNKDENNNETEKLSTQNSCLKFYAFNDDGGDTLNLLLDHNIAGAVQWNDYESSFEGGPKSEFLEQLKSSTENWKGTKTLEDYINPIENRNYTINYGEYKARLITSQEIVQITGNSNFDPPYYFHNLSLDKVTGSGSVCASEGCKYGWIYDRIAVNCTNYGCLNNSDVETRGYWTSTAQGNCAYYVGSPGMIGLDILYGHMAIRPVIEISKEKLK